MRIPVYRQFNAMDYPQFNNEEGERFLRHLNSVFDPIYQAVNGNLGFDNSNCEIREFKVSEDTEYLVTLRRIKGKLRAVRLLDFNLADYPMICWEHVGSSDYKIKISFDSAPTDPVLVRLLLEGS